MKLDLVVHCLHQMYNQNLPHREEGHRVSSPGKVRGKQKEYPKKTANTPIHSNPMIPIQSKLIPIDLQSLAIKPT